MVSWMIDRKWIKPFMSLKYHVIFKINNHQQMALSQIDHTNEK